FRRVYLDNAATTPVDANVFEAMKPFLTAKFGNPSSIHFYGQEARASVDRARHQTASLLNANPREIVFTSGGTESNNLAIRGLRERSSPNGGHIVTSAIEHPAVLETCRKQAKKGCGLTVVDVGENGIVDIDAIKAAITADTFLVTVMTANNEIGTIQPVREIGRHVRELRESGQKIWFHTDAVQAAGKIPVDVDEIGCDLLSISGHKIYGPKGIGALFVRRGARLEAQNLGGHQERETRGGTENVANIVALGEACAIAEDDFEESAKKTGALRREFEEFVLGTIPDTLLNGDAERRLPNISNISFEGVEGEGLLINLDMLGVAVSTGSACSSGSIDPSPVILALGRRDGMARGAVRFSFGRFNTEEDLEYVKEMVPRAVENLRKLSPRYQSAPGS
ncbi:MAG: cysteine desulfurase, partial [Acidobacteriota bacterium]|nr:cysteine desulfurase [Acidobacteriota bacterium]